MSNSSKTVVITGGTGGIGLQSAIGVAKHGHRVVVTGRNGERGQAGVARIKAESGNDDVHLALADVSRPAEVRRLGEELISRFPAIDVLVNNAGYLATEHRLSEDGLEMSVAVNVVAPVLLTEALLPALEAAAPARVINVTGGAPNSRLDVGSLGGAKTFSTMGVYNNSKRAMEAATLAQVPRLAERGVYANIVYPGPASTSMTQAMTSRSLPWYLRPLWPVFSRIMQSDDGGKSAAKAARSTIWAVDADALDRKAGLYFNSKSKRATLPSSVRDEGNQQAVMAYIGESTSG